MAYCLRFKRLSAVVVIFAGFIFGGNISAAADDLPQVLISAYNKNPRLQAERARVRAVDENYIQARAQSRPTIALSGSFAGSAVRTPQLSFFGPAGDVQTQTGTPAAAQLEIIQPIYQGGRLKAQRGQALAGIMSARESLKNMEQNIFLAAANAYVDIIRDEATARIRRKNVQVLSRQKQAAEVSFDIGDGTRTDIAQSDNRLAGAEIGLASADAQLEASRAVFRRVVGRDPIDLQPVPKMVIPNTAQEAISIALGNNPDLNAARFNRDASEYDINIARSATKPSLSLNASAAAQRDQILGFERADALTLTAQLRVPIFSAGMNQSRIRQARHVKTRLDFELRAAELQISQNVTQLWAQIDASQRSLLASQRQVDAAKFAFEGVELEQQVGTRSVLDVLDAEQEVLNAQINNLAAQRNLDAAIFQLLAIMGTFNANSLQLPVDIYDPRDNFEDVRSDILHNFTDNYVPDVVKAPVVRVKDSLLPAIGNAVAASGLNDHLERAGDAAGGAAHAAGKGFKTTIDAVTRRPLKPVPVKSVPVKPVKGQSD
jgi:outer membrane protein